MGAEGVWSFVSTGLLTVLQKKELISVGDVTPMIPVNPGVSWKNTKRYTKARYACSILRLSDLAFRQKNVKSVGETSLIVMSIHSFKSGSRKLLLLCFGNPFYLLLLSLFGTLMCMELKLQMLCYQSFKSLLCSDE